MEELDKKPKTKKNKTTLKSVMKIINQLIESTGGPVVSKKKIKCDRCGRKKKSKNPKCKRCKRTKKGLYSKKPKTEEPKTERCDRCGSKIKVHYNKFEGPNVRMKVKVNCSEIFCSFRRMMKIIRHRHARVVIVADGLPKTEKAHIEHFASLAKVPVIHYSRPWIECTNAWGKVFLLPSVALSTRKHARIIRSMADKLMAGYYVRLDGRVFNKKNHAK